MKKILLSLAMMLPALSMMAQERWTDNAEGPDETVLYLQIMDGENPDMVMGGLDGMSQVAAFIGNECRAVETNYFMDETGMRYEGIYRLRVKGNMGASANEYDSDFKKDITLKFYNYMNDGFVYKFSATYKFDGESHGTPSDPVKVRLIPVSQSDAIVVDGTVKQEENGWPIDYLYLPFPSTFDLSEAVHLTYGNNHSTTNTVSPVDTDETPIEFSYESPGLWTYFNVEDNLLTTLQVTYNPDYENDPDNGQALTINMQGMHPGVQMKLVYVVIKNKVTAISTDITDLTVYTRENVLTYFDGHVTILPEDATNTSYYIEEVVDPENVDPTGAPTTHITRNLATLAGTCKIRLVSADDPTLKSGEINVTILDRPYGIEIKEGESTELQLGVGNDLMAALHEIIDVLPTDGEYVDRTLGIVSDTKLWNDNYITTTTGDVWMQVYPKAQLYRATGGEGADSVTVHLTVFQTLDNITADNTDVLVYVDANVFEEIYERVTFVPATASNKNLRYRVEDNTIVNERTGIALAAGTTKVTAISAENASLTIDFNVTVKEPLGFSISNVTLKKNTDVELTIVKTGDDPIEGSKVELVIPNHANEGWGPVATAERADDSGLKWKLRGKYFGQYRYQVKYDGGIIPGAAALLTIPVEYDYAEGWNWISIPVTVPGADPTAITMASYNLNSDQELIDPENLRTSPIFEVRSQTGLVINDPQVGFVGDFKTIEANGQMYKLKANAAGTMRFGEGQPLMIDSDIDVQPGYNWIAYPYELDHSVDALNTTLSRGAKNSDMIIGKDGFAAYTGSNWRVFEGTFSFEAGKGYIYYSRANDTRTVHWGDQTLAPEETPAGARSLRPNVWQYDNRGFKESMAIIASVEDLDAPENYTIGAFVGDECRGRGGCVDGKWMFISVGGEFGETVSFRLHNELTGEYTDLEQALPFGRIAGTLDQPVSLFSHATGISNTYRESRGTECYDLSGRRVEGTQQGVVLRRTANGQVHKVMTR